MGRKKSVSVSPFFNNADKIISIPLLSYLAGKFEKHRVYSEKEVNQIINEWHTFNDYFILRRLLIDYKFIERTPNGEKYWVIKNENEEGNI